MSLNRECKYINYKNKEWIKLVSKKPGGFPYLENILKVYLRVRDLLEEEKKNPSGFDYRQLKISLLTIEEIIKSLANIHAVSELKNERPYE